MRGLAPALCWMAPGARESLRSLPDSPLTAAASRRYDHARGVTTKGDAMYRKGFASLALSVILGCSSTGGELASVAAPTSNASDMDAAEIRLA